MKATVLIRPKEGILEPQGKAVERALPALGFSGIHEVRVGRMVELEVDDPEDLASLCEKLLANPLIEDYEITTSDGSSAPAQNPLPSADASGDSTEPPRPGPSGPEAG